MVAEIQPIELSKGGIDPLEKKIFVDDRQPHRSIREKGIELRFPLFDIFPLLSALRYVACDHRITTRFTLFISQEGDVGSRPELSAVFSDLPAFIVDMALLQGRAPTNATYLAKDFGPQLLSNWETLLNGVSRAADFLEQERVFDSARLPTDVVVPVLVALWAIAPSGLDAEGRARTILRKYLWRAFFSDRYEKSTNSRVLTDFNELKSLITGATTSTHGHL